MHGACVRGYDQCALIQVGNQIHDLAAAIEHHIVWQITQFVDPCLLTGSAVDEHFDSGLMPQQGY